MRTLDGLDGGKEGNISQGAKSGFLPLSLKDSIAGMIDGALPSHTELNIDGLRDTIRRSVLALHTGEVLMCALTGFPGVGKSSKVGKLRSTTQGVLGLFPPKEFIVYKNSGGTVIQSGGYIGGKGEKVVLTISLDHFFRAKGTERRELMLQNFGSFKRLWGDSRELLNFVLDVFTQGKTDIRIYTGSPEERINQKSSGTIEIKNPVAKDATVVTIVEGVNAGWIADRIQRIRFSQKINIEKILFNVSPAESLIRILRRDHDNKKQSFEYIIENRIKEYFFILKIFILPALKDPATILLTKKRNIPPFTEAERGEILDLLTGIQQLYPEASVSHKSEIVSAIGQQGQREFVSHTTAQLIEYFEVTPGVTPEELERWQKDKAFRKAKKRLEERKLDASFYQRAQGEIHQAMKRIYNKMISIRGRIGGKK